MPLSSIPPEERTSYGNKYTTDDDCRDAPTGRSHGPSGQHVTYLAHAATSPTTNGKSETIHLQHHHLQHHHLQPSVAMGLRQVASKPLKKLKRWLAKWARRGDGGLEGERNQAGRRPGVAGDEANLRDRDVPRYPEVVEGGPSRGERDLDRGADHVGSSTSNPPNSHNKKPNGMLMVLSQLLYR